MKCFQCQQDIPYEEDIFLAVLYSLSPREYMVLIWRFLENKTLEQAGKSGGVTRERIRQVELKTLRKLYNRGKRFGLLLDVDNLRMELERVKDKLQGVKQVIHYEWSNGEEYKQSDLKRYETKEVDLQLKNKFTDLQKVCSSALFEPKWLFESIAELDLPTRAENCLRAGGITRIIDLINKSKEDLLVIKNFGKKTIKQVEDHLSFKGLDLGLEISQAEIESLYEHVNNQG